ncbi:unnamed protein product [Amoebophrya sp. A120]|nr:unnamed protein product [Amoebophrya sp. A120]|eukprot:GSA120T00019461001.1
MTARTERVSRPRGCAFLGTALPVHYIYAVPTFLHMEKNTKKLHMRKTQKNYIGEKRKKITYEKNAKKLHMRKTPKKLHMRRTVRSASVLNPNFASSGFYFSAYKKNTKKYTVAERRKVRMGY